MPIRRSFDALGAAERDRFLEAVLILKNTRDGDLNIYDRFVALHAGAMSVTTSPGVATNMGHLEAGFLPWHRQLILKFEEALNQAVNRDDVGIPYWDWTRSAQTGSVLLTDEFASASGRGPITSGYFAGDAPGTATNPTARPSWWPAGMDGFRIHPGLSQGLGTTLVRNVGALPELAWQSEVDAALEPNNYEVFRRSIEAGPRMHNFGHNWVGGHMRDVLVSPNDPIFWMHHANVDRLWHQWQTNGHGGAGFYPSSGEPTGHNLHDAMWPWVANADGYASQRVEDWALPDVGQGSRVSPNDVLDITQLGYEYA